MAADVGETSDKLKVLVVDDDPYMRILLSLEVPDVDLLEASTIDDAYELARSGDPQVILVDRRLADGDGLDLVRRLRRNRALAQLPILVITAGHDEADRAAVVKAGADEYVPKPLEATELMVRVRRLLELPPEELKRRRTRLLAALQHGDAHGDPDPLPPQPPGGERASGRRGFLDRFRRR